MLNLIAAGATYLFPGGRALKLVKDGINVTNSTIIQNIYKQKIGVHLEYTLDEH